MDEYPGSEDPSNLSIPAMQYSEHEEMSFYKCEYPLCDRTFRFSSEYQRHFISHEEQRPYRCPYMQICNKAFKRSDALKTHIRLHTGEKPYLCHVGSCKLSFSTKAGLRYHVLKHRNDKMFRCDFPGCIQSFLTPTQLNQHKKRIKVHENLVFQQNSDADSGQREPDSNDFMTIMNESFRFEPTIAKRVQLEPLHEISTTSAVVSTNKDENAALIDKIQKPAVELLQLEGLATSGLPNLHSLNPDLFKIDLNPSVSTTSRSNDNANEQTSLLRRISDILDENIVLKQHIQIYQKVVEICRIGLGTNPLMTMINSIKDGKLDFKGY